MSDQIINDRGDSLQNNNSDEDIFRASEEFKEDAHFSSFNQLKVFTSFSVADKQRFWSGEARELHWFNLWKKLNREKHSPQNGLLVEKLI